MNCKLYQQQFIYRACLFSQKLGLRLRRYRSFAITTFEDKNAGITVSRKQFKGHMKLLADSGYHTMLPNELYYYLTSGKSLLQKL